MDDSIENDTSGNPYDKWINDLRVKDLDCYHDYMGALLWMAADPTVDVVKIKEHIKGKYDNNTDIYKVQIRRNADILYGIYTPSPITDLWIGYSPMGQQYSMNKIEVPKSDNGYYWFDIPLPTIILNYGQLYIHYRMEPVRVPDIPVTLVTGWLSSKCRQEICEYTDQSFVFAKDVGVYLKDPILLECHNVPKLGKPWILRPSSTDSSKILNLIKKNYKKFDSL